MSACWNGLDGVVKCFLDSNKVDADYINEKGQVRNYLNEFKEMLCCRWCYSEFCFIIVLDCFCNVYCEFSIVNYTVLIETIGWEDSTYFRM